ncbi:MaoC/PaaZ C-terminal domain-containing protein [Desulfosporosinus sp. BICA1-9]|uniref:MaoC family dehydratase n=1 Tax=Desulfosporosinus sp. BICA1-9 TaxID=1531958 RepID=UPI00054B0F34|nr:MaoC/PaaZ C-terminal domain-containing protein [Desulfosporosinus sp. BICA1-9]KJS46291.1 MAG: dehydratase [Peptococcaceae bacterium BRH_c23]KJS86880.1 MAG: dehydratase [Desulfosporosinus sp. BICA1-9]HBW37022.1 dehydratase [Desulfosporosinus sp.]
MIFKVTGLTFDEINVGDEFHTVSRTISEADVVSFAGISGDYNPLHTDEEWAKENTPFGGRIAHGVLIQSIATGLANQLGVFLGTTIAVLEMTSRFVGAVRFGDTIRAVLIVTEKKESKNVERGIIKVSLEVSNQKNEAVMQGNWILMLRKSCPTA